MTEQQPIVYIDLGVGGLVMITPQFDAHDCSILHKNRRRDGNQYILVQ